MTGVTFLALFFSFFLVIPLVSAQQPSETPESTVQIQDPGPHFRFGERVTISENLSGDVYVAGQNVIVDGDISGDLLVGGRRVEINGNVTNDVRVGAGEVIINGTVGGNITVGAGVVHFRPSSQVNGSVVIGAGEAIFEGTVQGKTHLGVGELTMAGVFGDSVQGQVSEGEVQSEASISGDLRIQTNDQLNVASTASISGVTDITDVEEHDRKKWFPWMTETTEEVAKQGINLGWTIFMFVVGLIGGSVLLYLFPRQMRNFNTSILTNTLGSLGWGFAKLFLTPFVILFLFLSILGIPFAFIVLFLYIISLFIAGWIGSYALGSWIVGRAVPQSKALTSPYLQFVLGLFIFTIAKLIPVLGGLFQMIVMMFGLGALFISEKNYLLRSKSYPLASTKSTKK